MGVRVGVDLGDVDWTKARCRDFDAELFFGTDGESPQEARTREAAAVAVCRHCPVVHGCRQYALAAPEPYGVWGALTEDERKTISFRRTRVRCPGCRGRDVVRDLFLDRVEVCRNCGLSWRV